jgi:hypothetical protein
MPGLFGNNKFLIKFPFALPNIVASVLFMVGISTGFLFLKVRDSGSPLHSANNTRKLLNLDVVAQIQVFISGRNYLPSSRPSFA